MRRDLIKKVKSSFLSCEKDTETILRKLFVESGPYGRDLKKLLIINTRDCLDADNVNYNRVVDNTNLSDLRKQGYLRLEPKIRFNEHEEVKSYILISFDNFTPNMNNPEYRDCIVTFDIICHTDYWDIGDYRMRPIKIAGIIDGILNEEKLSGIGKFYFAGCNQLILNEDLSGYSLMFQAIHDVEGDDSIPPKEYNSH